MEGEIDWARMVGGLRDAAFALEVLLDGLDYDMGRRQQPHALYERSEVSEHVIEIRLAIEVYRYLNLAWNRRHVARDQAYDDDERHEWFSRDFAELWPDAYRRRAGLDAKGRTRKLPAPSLSAT